MACCNVAQRSSRAILLAGIAMLVLAQACSERKRSPSHHGTAEQPASLPRRAEDTWSRYGWTDLRWGMGPGDGIPRLPSAEGGTWRTSDSDREALGMGVDLAHAVVLKEPVHGHEVKVVLKFSDSHGLMGLVLVTPPDGGMTRWRCSSVFEKLQAGLKGELGPGKDGVSFASNTPRTEWLSDKMRLKLTQQLNSEGCFVQMSYVDPDLYKD
jgi:hypothetical protein